MYTTRIVGVRLGTYYGRAVLHPMLASPPAVAVLWFAKSRGWLQRWDLLAAAVFLAVLLYFVTAWFVCLASRREIAAIEIHCDVRLGAEQLAAARAVRRVISYIRETSDLGTNDELRCQNQRDHSGLQFCGLPR